jgi:hypothetical protein
MILTSQQIKDRIVAQIAQLNAQRESAALATGRENK